MWTGVFVSAKPAEDNQKATYLHSCWTSVHSAVRIIVFTCIDLRAWQTTDKSWLILSTDNVRHEESFVCHRKIGQFFSADNISRLLSVVCHAHYSVSQLRSSLPNVLKMAGWCGSFSESMSLMARNRKIYQKPLAFYEFQEFVVQFLAFLVFSGALITWWVLDYCATFNISVSNGVICFLLSGNNQISSII